MKEDICPDCGAPVERKTKYETTYQCGSAYPVDWSSTQSEQCKENVKNKGEK